jgi:hypothetical protein
VSERKIQQTLFDSREMPTENWAWVVEFQYNREMMDANGRDPREPLHWESVPRPNHFRLETNAVKRVQELSVEYAKYIKMGLVQFRFEPKYVGYVPPEDETWIS